LLRLDFWPGHLGETSATTLTAGSYNGVFRRLTWGSMKYPLSAFLVLALAFGQASTSAPASSAQAIPVDQENARKAKTLLDQMVDALGGNAYLNVEDISQEGRSYGFHLGQSEGVGLVFWRFYKFPDQERIELTKKRDVVYVYRGDKGFEITYKGTRSDDPKVVSEYLRRREYSLDWVIRKWLSQPGIALFYEGHTVASQRDAEQVTIMNSRNQGVTLYIDAKTHLPVKKTFSWRDPTDQQRNIEDEVYDNYRPVQGVMTPYSVTRFYNGDMSNQRFLNTVVYNKGLSDSMFAVDVTYDPSKPAPRK
jgi:hypothetical protein